MVSDYSPLPVPQEWLDTPPDSSPLRKFIKEYLTNCIIEEKSPETLNAYAQRLNDFLDHSGGTSPLDVREYFHQLINRGLSSSTRNAYYRALHTFFTWVVKEGYMEKHPLANIKPPRFPKKMPPSFSTDEIKKLLLLTSGLRFLEIRNRAMLLVFMDTGLRLAELSALKKDDIDILTGRIVVMGKGSKERAVRIGKAARKAVYKYLCSRDDSLPALWLSEERRPMTKDGVKITIKKLCVRAGIKGGAHKLRHTAAVNYLRNGGTVFNLQIMLGHSDLTMTRHYASSLNSDDVLLEHQSASPVDNMEI